eukprot:Protomagalhaensia_wolfi_Nauph_80__2566@NODE_271_length_2978_cov_689_825111_g202_i0_p1_GENE_NODE_271_length_2978_cov_689_825111_g202_i0NODE_271_length_2978_cov_689_825111_g202_i0_p1_ORF_typecomplete_len304_score63_03DUF1295/PF06966_12/6_3e40ERG4_ERG24/PF01222_17/1_9e03ERG4_ERG24/PF01222_17/7_1e10PEMT/PF04191_13/1_7e04PEMT/PF04191_13/3e03PEMT/PF04191_13/9_9e06ICMT/PF04140_14/1_8e04ICMT/PF04140_14/5_7e03ICMT/PF04140_14/4_7e03ICMT/PF04140_14/3_7e05Steroid_dh/PF02544_16/6_2e02Steroid_dh/PF02544_16/1e
MEIVAWVWLSLAFLLPAATVAGLWQHDDCKAWMKDHPVVLANLLMLVHMDLYYYMVSLIQRSVWLIDAMWQGIPLLLNTLYYVLGTDTTSFRPLIVSANLILWSARLTHNYFRRENWRLGEREDWRYADLRQRFGWHWWWIQLFAVEISQHIWLFAVTYPLLEIHRGTIGLNWLDVVAALVCLTGLAVSRSADDKLFEFQRLKQAKELPQSMMLMETPWNWCRHPNYLGESIWWFGIGLSALAAGGTWYYSLAGSLFNVLAFGVTLELVENRMGDPSRNSAAKIDNYRGYCLRVPKKLLPGIY